MALSHALVGRYSLVFGSGGTHCRAADTSLDGGFRVLLGLPLLDLENAGTVNADAVNS